MEFLIGLGLSIVSALYAVYTKWSADKDSGEIKLKLSKLESDNSELEKERGKNEELIRRLRARLPEERRSTILMDGATGSGKSCFVARIACPTVTDQELKNMSTTVGEYQTLDAPVCWDQNESKSVLHTIRFHDVAGERPSKFVNAVNKLSAEDSEQPVVLLIMWDLSKEFAYNERYLNNARCEACYKNDNARKLIKKVIVFINKIESIDQKERVKRVQAEASAIRKHLGGVLQGDFGDLVIQSGSVRDGSGIHALFGEVLRALKIDVHFQPVLGNAGVTTPSNGAD